MIALIRWLRYVDHAKEVPTSSRSAQSLRQARHALRLGLALRHGSILNDSAARLWFSIGAYQDCLSAVLTAFGISTEPFDVQSSAQLFERLGLCGPDAVKACELVREPSSESRITLPLDELLDMVRFLEQVLPPLLQATDRHIVSSDQITRTRRRRTLLAVLPALLLSASLLGAWRHRMVHRGDLAYGKPWHATSQWGSYSESGTVSSSRTAFFHTNNEASPAIRIDLQTVEPICRVQVTNRKDCCANRAVPLVVEVSTDETTWKEVATRTEQFSEWYADFAPISARYVRLRATRETMLHLADVKVFKN